jgi:putative oxidoreductase
MAELALEHTEAAPGKAKAKVVGLWALQVLVAAVFLSAGGAKLTGATQMVRMFDVIGIGQWFRYLTGGLEVLGAIGLLIPAVAGVAAVLLSAVMICAVATHLFVIGGSPVVPIVLFLAGALIASARRDQIRAALSR